MGSLLGGYSQIDCSGIELTTETKQTIAGIYKQVLRALKANKQVLACNLKFATNPCTPVGVMINVAPSGESIVCTSSTLQLWVDSNDGVTVVNMAPTTKTTKSTK